MLQQRLTATTHAEQHNPRQKAVPHVIFSTEPSMKAQQRGKIHSNSHKLHSAGNYDGTTGPPSSQPTLRGGARGTLTGAKTLGTKKKRERREQLLQCIVKAYCAAAYCETFFLVKYSSRVSTSFCQVNIGQPCNAAAF